MFVNYKVKEEPAAIQPVACASATAAGRNYLVLKKTISYFLRELEFRA
jgi:hypothetical protein